MNITLQTIQITTMIKYYKRVGIWRNVFILLLFLFSNCARQSTVSDLEVKKNHIPIFITMAKNPLVFENVSPLIYQTFHHLFMRIGYIPVGSSKDGYTLRVKIKKLDPIQKFVSQDIILMHSIIQTELECTLLDFNQRIVAEKTFFHSSLLSKSKNPILNSSFSDMEYQKLFERIVPKIERFFRPYLLKAFSDNHND